MTKSFPHENPENSPPPPPKTKKKQKKQNNYSSPLLIVNDIQNYLYTYVFEDDKKDEIF